MSSRWPQSRSLLSAKAGVVQLVRAAGLETTLALGTLAAVALHVVVGRRPRPGRGRHLPPGSARCGSRPDRGLRFGSSVGGEILLEAAAQSTVFKAVVAEGACLPVGEGADVLRGTETPSARTVWNQDRDDRVLQPRSLPIVDRIGRIAPRSVFLIYAKPGMGGEHIRQPKYFAAAGEPKSIWKVPGAEHTGGIDASPAEYERRVVGFYNRALLRGDRSQIASTNRTSRGLRARQSGAWPTGVSLQLVSVAPCARSVTAMPPKIAIPSSISTGASGSSWAAVRMSTPPERAFAFDSTRQPDGIWSATPPKRVCAVRRAPGASSASRRSSAMPPNQAIAEPPLKPFARLFRSMPSNTATSVSSSLSSFPREGKPA